MSELKLGMSIVIFIITLYKFVLEPKLINLYNNIKNYFFPNTESAQQNQYRFNFINNKNVTPIKEIPKKPDFNAYNAIGNANYGYNNYNYNRVSSLSSLFTPTAIKRQSSVKDKNIICKPVYFNNNYNRTNNNYNESTIVKPGFLNATNNLTPANIFQTKKKSMLNLNTPSHMINLQGRVVNENRTNKFNVAKGLGNYLIKSQTQESLLNNNNNNRVSVSGIYDYKEGLNNNNIRSNSISNYASLSFKPNNTSHTQSYNSFNTFQYITENANKNSSNNLNVFANQQNTLMKSNQNLTMQHKPSYVSKYSVEVSDIKNKNSRYM